VLEFPQGREECGAQRPIWRCAWRLMSPAMSSKTMLTRMTAIIG
jgi:hypothetical protein